MIVGGRQYRQWTPRILVLVNTNVCDQLYRRVGATPKNVAREPAAVYTHYLASGRQAFQRCFSGW